MKKGRHPTIFQHSSLCIIGVKAPKSLELRKLQQRDRPRLSQHKKISSGRPQRAHDSNFGGEDDSNDERQH